MAMCWRPHGGHRGRGRRAGSLRLRAKQGSGTGRGPGLWDLPSFLGISTFPLRFPWKSAPAPWPWGTGPVTCHCRGRRNKQRMASVELWNVYYSKEQHLSSLTGNPVVISENGSRNKQSSVPLFCSDFIEVRLLYHICKVKVYNTVI